MSKKRSSYRIAGRCPSCFSRTFLKAHAIFPEPLFEKNNYFIYLCDSCSERLNRVLLRHNKISEVIFYRLHKSFIRLGNGDIPVTKEKACFSNKFEAVCPRCFGLRYLEKHHMFPKRFFGENKNLLFLCSDCHLQVERMIPRYQMLKEWVYVDLHKAFIRNLKSLYDVDKILEREDYEKRIRKTG